MTAWITVLSQFTDEALVLEAIAILSVATVYVGFWVARKRRLGALRNQEVPAGVVKTYLSELIHDATTMRTYLFGLLNAPGTAVPAGAHAGAALAGATGIAAEAAAPGATTGPALDALEQKLAEQARAMEAIVADKTRLETELTTAKAAGAAAGAGAGATGAAGAGNQADLEKRIRELEAKLAEYNVIEDDLANLKKLQQENAQLRAQLAARGGAATPEAAAAPPPATEPALAAEPTPMPVADAAAPAGDAFEGLVDQVEATLQPEPVAPAAVAAPAAAVAAAAPVAAAPPPAAPKAPETPAPAAASPPTPPSAEKSDADLVAEFEKMLSSQ